MEGKIVTIDEKIAQLEKQLRELKAEKENMWPKEGDMYWHVLSYGEVLEDRCWADSQMEWETMRIGNVFRTEEGANRAVARLRARKKFLDYGGHEGCWDGSYYGEVWLAYPQRRSKILIPYELERESLGPFEVWFEFEEDCRTAIDSLTEEERAALCWQGGEE